jgi:predicted cupin superfamily sugar epimerase
MNPKFLIYGLGLIKHPEGGYYKETYRAADTLNN